MGALTEPWLQEFRLPQAAWNVMLRDIQQRGQEEACGLLAVSAEQVITVFPITNQLHSPVRFYMQPEEMLSVFLEIEESGSELLAIYHSHPNGPAQPSPTDMAEFRYPGIIYLICSPQEQGWMCRAFFISGEGYREIPCVEISQDVF